MKKQKKGFKIISYFLPDEKTFEEKYRKIYGVGEHEKPYSEYYAKQKKNLQVIALLMIVVFAAVLFKCSVSEFTFSFEKDSIRAVQREEGTMTIPLVIEIIEKGKTIKKNVTLTIEDGAEKKESQDNLMNESFLIDEKVYEAVKTAQESPSKKEILLPDRLEDGTKLKWSQKRDLSWIAVLVLMLTVLIYIRRSRFHSIEKIEKDFQKNIKKELPDFISNFALLLNTGVVQSAAFEKIISRRSIENSRNKSYFYIRLKNISNKTKEINSDFESELCRFAKDSGVKEFIRIASIIEENVSRGTSLSDKMEKESSFLWFMKKKQAEEEGRLAETKLVAPLMLLLLILIVLTIAPAMLKM